MSRTARGILNWGGWWLALATVYVLFIAKIDAQEWAAGAVLAALAATAAHLTQGTGKSSFAVRLRWLPVAARLPANIVADCGKLIAALFASRLGRRPQGKMREVPFDTGLNGPVSRARRALVIGGVSLGPNTFVLHIDGKRQSLVVHQLVVTKQSPGKGDRQWPI